MALCDFNAEVEPIIHPYKFVEEFNSIEPHTDEKLQIRGWQDSSKKVQDNFLVGILKESSNKLGGSPHHRQSL